MERLHAGMAYLVRGDERAIERVLTLLQKEGVASEGNPDVYVRSFARFGIDDARQLGERATLRGQGGARIFIISTPTMTVDAQNALLKTLEEPPAGARFFLVVPSPQTLLPTLRSRCQLLMFDTAAADEVVPAGAFLAAEPQKRLDMLKPLLEKDEDDKRDLRPILAFLASLEAKLAAKPAGLHALYRARKYIGDRGALVKPLLEQVALLVPRV